MSTPPSTPAPFPTPDTDRPHSEAPGIASTAPTSADVPSDDQQDPPARDLVDIPAGEVISRAVVMLMSAAAEQLGLAAADPDDPPHRDLDQARTLITALAGLVNASLPDLGPHAAAFRDGLSALQKAFREYSLVQDEPGQGPGEKLGRP